METIGKIIKAGTALLLALALCACGGREAPATSDGTYVKPVAGQTQAKAAAPATTTAPATTESLQAVPDTTAAPQTANPSSAEASAEASVPPATTLAVISSGLAPGQTTAGPDTSAGQGSFEAEDLIFTYKGKSIRTGDVFSYADFEADWGGPQIEKGQACLGGGFDENYYFGDTLTVFTLGDSGQQLIYDIFIMEEGYSTAKGAVIGQTTREELPAIYGQPHSSMGATDRYSLEDVLVSFTFSGGILAEIDYNNTQN